jgi:4-diphosphocytidyl-2-C-methyl-D-erythritol kinase
VIVLSAPAKLTLNLRVTGVRADGFHLIDSEMTSLTIADTVLIDDEFNNGLNDAVDTTTISVNGPYAAGVPTDSSNLVHKALALVGRSATVQITKNIPHGGGLGGGSTDAAAILRWANFTDLNAAARIGADVSFCLVGGRARVQGIGEVVTPLPTHAQDITLFIPPIHVSTPAVYKKWDELGGPEGPNGNDLEPAALAVEPDLATWRDAIGYATGETPLLAGSGATWFVMGHHNVTLPGAQVVHTSTV